MPLFRSRLEPRTRATRLMATSTTAGRPAGLDSQDAQSRLRLIVDPGARLLAVRHPVRPPLLPAGRQRRGLPGAGRVPVRARDRRAAPAGPGRRRPWVALWSPTAARGWCRSTGRCSARWTRTCGGPLLVARVAHAVGLPTQKVEGGGGRLLTCGAEGSVAGTCWNGSPFQPVPHRHRRRASSVALLILEQPEDFPAVLAEQQSVHTCPVPYGINLAHVLGYLSPITEDELDVATDEGGTPRSTAPPAVGRAGVEKQYDQWLRGMPGYQRVAVDSMGRVLGEDSDADGPAGRHPGHLDRRQGPGRGRAAARARRSRPRAQTYDKVTRPELRGRLGSRRRAWRPGRAGSSRWPASRRTTPTCGSAASARSSSAGSTPRRPAPPCSSRATQGQFAPGSTWKPIMTVGALNNGFCREHPAATARPGCRSGNRVVQELRVGVLRLHRLRPGARRSPATPSSTGSASTSGRGTAPTRPTSNAKDPLVAEAKSFGFGSRDRRRPTRRGDAAGSPTGTGSSPTSSR